MKDKTMIAGMALAIAIVALCCMFFEFQGGAKATAPQAVKNVSTEAVAAVPQIALKTVSFDVPGMTCPSCPYTVKKTLKRIDGVIEADSSFETMSATATFDENKTSVDVLLEALKNQGYPSSVAEGS